MPEPHPDQVETQPLGALHRITPEVTLAALTIPKRGQTIDLGSVLSRDMPKGRGQDDTFAPFQVLRHRTTTDLARDGGMGETTFSTELIQGTPHVGSHFDAFCHVQLDGRVYGGGTAAEHERDFGWTHAGMETVGPVMTRGVLLDIASDRGVDQLPGETEIGLDEVQLALDRRRLAIHSGDAVLIRTGKMRDYDDPSKWAGANPGLGVDAGIWLYEQGVAVLGADNPSVEPNPTRDWGRHLHGELLYRRGVHLLEWLDLEGLRDAGTSEFLFCALPLKIRGATGSWIRPVAVI
ncbi:MAG TPA: cyclase family protein [Thermomicrobiales bacterium]|jgi:kynurenine formamidase|nr:cyclase family protein [Thermomicrobiales bacterium]